MQFAWRRRKLTDYTPLRTGVVGRVLHVIYNLLYWPPLVLNLTGHLTDREAFHLFAAVIIFRAAANVYRVNALDVARGEAFPLRSP
jgi:hypothetical protein